MTTNDVACKALRSLLIRALDPCPPQRNDRAMNESLPLGVSDAFAVAFFLGAWALFALAADGRLVQADIAHAGDERATRSLDAYHGAARAPDDRHRHHVRAAARHGFFRVERAGGDRQLLCIAGRHRPRARRAVRLAVLRHAGARGVRDQDDRAHRVVCLRLFQVRLVVPAVQLLLDPDRRGAGAAR